jgi:DNA-binding MarR family transcriptional regulator
VTQLYDEELAGTGVGIAQFTLLQALSKSGTITQGRLGSLLALDSTTLTRTLKPLEAARWIRIRPGEDRRERHLELTAAGEEQLDRASASWERAQKRLRTVVGDGEWGKLLGALTAVAGAAREA